MLYDEYRLKYEQSGGAVPIANNADFTVNLLEYLNGTEDLIGLRGKVFLQYHLLKLKKSKKKLNKNLDQKNKNFLKS